MIKVEKEDAPPYWSSLKICLIHAVPLWMIEHRRKSYDELIEKSKKCGDVVGEKGDVLVFGSSRSLRSAEAFNRLAEGIAISLLVSKKPISIYNLVFWPSGVTTEEESVDAAIKKCFEYKEKT